MYNLYLPYIYYCIKPNGENNVSVYEENGYDEVLFGLVFTQSPIIRVKQIGTWDTPQTWWKDSQTQNLSTFLRRLEWLSIFKNNNFDSWRDKLLEIEVTLDDNNTTNYITAVRFDIAFDNDLITWVEQDIDGDIRMKLQSMVESR